MEGPHQGPGSHLRTLRRLAAAGVGIEALGLIGVGVAYGVHAFSLAEPAFAVGLATFAALIGVGLALAARALARGARWAVSAVLTWQALLTLAGISLTSQRPVVGAIAAGVGAGLGTLVVVASRDVLARDR